jgi:hypothetical protein
MPAGAPPAGGAAIPGPPCPAPASCAGLPPIITRVNSLGPLGGGGAAGAADMPKFVPPSGSSVRYDGSGPTAEGPCGGGGVPPLPNMRVYSPGSWAADRIGVGASAFI